MKKVILNIILLVTTYFLPMYLLYLQQEVTISMESIGLIFLLVGAVVLIYLNNKYRKQEKDYKWLWIIFEIVGIIGLLYSVSILFILFGLRNLGTF